MTTRRLVSIVLPAAIGVAVCWWLIAASEGRLPDELATHWGGSGEPDGFSTLGDFLTFTGAMAAVFFALATAVAVVLGPRLRQLSGLATGAPGAVAGFFSVIVAMTILVNRDTAGIDADLPLWQSNLTVLGLVGGGVVGALIAGPNRFPEPEPVETGGEVVSATVTWRGAWILAALLAVGGLVMAVFTQIVILLLLAPVILAFTHYHLTLGPAGVVASGATFGWPTFRIPASDIRGARVVDVHPFRQWGGWGLRARLDGSQALVTRSGPGVEFELGGKAGKVFVATVDDPERFVAAAEGLTARAES